MTDKVKVVDRSCRPGGGADKWNRPKTVATFPDRDAAAKAVKDMPRPVHPSGGHATRTVVDID